ADAREEIEGDDDDITLADHLRDIESDFEDAVSARTYGRDLMLTRDAGVTIRTKDGAEFQITIVQTRQGTGDDRDEDEGAGFDDSDCSPAGPMG
nr:hypothetical protein [Phycisphaerales bacterium]